MVEKKYLLRICGGLGAEASYQSVSGSVSGSGYNRETTVFRESFPRVSRGTPVDHCRHKSWRGWTRCPNIHGVPITAISSERAKLYKSLDFHSEAAHCGCSPPTARGRTGELRPGGAASAAPDASTLARRHPQWHPVTPQSTGGRGTAQAGPTGHNPKSIFFSTTRAAWTGFSYRSSFRGSGLNPQYIDVPTMS